MKGIKAGHEGHKVWVQREIIKSTKPGNKEHKKCKPSVILFLKTKSGSESFIRWLMGKGHKEYESWAQRQGTKAGFEGCKGHKGRVQMMQRLTTKGTRAGCKDRMLR